MMGGSYVAGPGKVDRRGEGEPASGEPIGLSLWSIGANSSSSVYEEQGRRLLELGMAQAAAAAAAPVARAAAKGRKRGRKEGGANRWSTHDKETCRCAVCLQLRGESRSSWFRHDRSVCRCAVCRQSRGADRTKRARPLGPIAPSAGKERAQPLENGCWTPHGAAKWPTRGRSGGRRARLPPPPGGDLLLPWRGSSGTALRPSAPTLQLFPESGAPTWNQRQLPEQLDGRGAPLPSRPPLEFGSFSAALPAPALNSWLTPERTFGYPFNAGYSYDGRQQAQANSSNNPSSVGWSSTQFNCKGNFTASNASASWLSSALLQPYHKWGTSSALSPSDDGSGYPCHPALGQADAARPCSGSYAGGLYRNSMSSESYESPTYPPLLPVVPASPGTSQKPEARAPDFPSLMSYYQAFDPPVRQTPISNFPFGLAVEQPAELAGNSSVTLEFGLAVEQPADLGGNSSVTLDQAFLHSERNGALRKGLSAGDQANQEHLKSVQNEIVAVCEQANLEHPMSAQPADLGGNSSVTLDQAFLHSERNGLAAGDQASQEHLKSVKNEIVAVCEQADLKHPMSAQPADLGDNSSVTLYQATICSEENRPLSKGPAAGEQASLEHLKSVQDYMLAVKEQANPDRVESIRNGMVAVGEAPNSEHLNPVQDDLEAVVVAASPEHSETVEYSMGTVGKAANLEHSVSLQDVIVDVREAPNSEHSNPVQDDLDAVVVAASPEHSETVKYSMGTVGEAANPEHFVSLQDVMVDVKEAPNSEHLNPVQDDLEAVVVIASPEHSETVEYSMGTVGEAANPGHSVSIQDNLVNVGEPANSELSNSVQDGLAVGLELVNPEHSKAVEDNMGTVGEAPNAEHPMSLQDDTVDAGESDKPELSKSVQDVTVAVLSEAAHPEQSKSVQDDMGSFGEGTNSEHSDSVRDGLVAVVGAASPEHSKTLEDDIAEAVNSEHPMSVQGDMVNIRVTANPEHSMSVQDDMGALAEAQNPEHLKSVQDSMVDVGEAANSEHSDSVQDGLVAVVGAASPEHSKTLEDNIAEAVNSEHPMSVQGDMVNIGVTANPEHSMSVPDDMGVLAEAQNPEHLKSVQDSMMDVGEAANSEHSDSVQDGLVAVVGAASPEHSKTLEDNIAEAVNSEHPMSVQGDMMNIGVTANPEHSTSVPDDMGVLAEAQNPEHLKSVQNSMVDVGEAANSEHSDSVQDGLVAVVGAASPEHSKTLEDNIAEAVNSEHPMSVQGDMMNIGVTANPEHSTSVPDDMGVLAEAQNPEHLKSVQDSMVDVEEAANSERLDSVQDGLVAVVGAASPEHSKTLEDNIGKAVNPEHPMFVQGDMVNIEETANPEHSMSVQVDMGALAEAQNPEHLKSVQDSMVDVEEAANSEHLDSVQDDLEAGLETASPEQLKAFEDNMRTAREAPNVEHSMSAQDDMMNQHFCHVRSKLLGKEKRSSRSAPRWCQLLRRRSDQLVVLRKVSITRRVSTRRRDQRKQTSLTPCDDQVAVHEGSQTSCARESDAERSSCIPMQMVGVGSQTDSPDLCISGRVKELPDNFGPYCRDLTLMKETTHIRPEEPHATVGVESARLPKSKPCPHCGCVPDRASTQRSELSDSISGTTGRDMDELKDEEMTRSRWCKVPELIEVNSADIELRSEVRFIDDSQRENAAPESKSFSFISSPTCNRDAPKREMSRNSRKRRGTEVVSINKRLEWRLRLADPLVRNILSKLCVGPQERKRSWTDMVDFRQRRELKRQVYVGPNASASEDLRLLQPALKKHKNFHGLSISKPPLFTDVDPLIKSFADERGADTSFGFTITVKGVAQDSASFADLCQVFNLSGCKMSVSSTTWTRVLKSRGPAGTKIDQSSNSMPGVSADVVLTPSVCRPDSELGNSSHLRHANVDGMECSWARNKRQRCDLWVSEKNESLRLQVELVGSPNVKDVHEEDDLSESGERLAQREPTLSFGSTDSKREVRAEEPRDSQQPGNRSAAKEMRCFVEFERKPSGQSSSRKRECISQEDPITRRLQPFPSSFQGLLMSVLQSAPNSAIAPPMMSTSEVDNCFGKRILRSHSCDAAQRTHEPDFREDTSARSSSRTPTSSPQSTLTLSNDVSRFGSQKRDLFKQRKALKKTPPATTTRSLMKRPPEVNKTQRIKITQLETDSDSDCEIVEQTRDSIQTIDNAEYKRKLEKRLGGTFAIAELRKLDKEVNERKPVLRLRESRRESSHVNTGKDGKSYLDRYPDLARKLARSRSPKAKLKLLRGFFFWLQHACTPGSFKPWKNPSTLSSEDCLEVPSEGRTALSVQKARLRERKSLVKKNVRRMALRPRNGTVQTLQKPKPRKGTKMKAKIELRSAV